METQTTLAAISRVFLDSAGEIVPRVLLALLLGALIEEFPSEQFIARFLTGKNPGTMALVAVVGALIPLCTCGMVPLAVALRRRGGDLKHTFAFLTAGAAVSIPVLLLTWKLIGITWLVVRFMASVALGLLAGYASSLVLAGAAARSLGTSPGRNDGLALVCGGRALRGVGAGFSNRCWAASTGGSRPRWCASSVPDSEGRGRCGRCPEAGSSSRLPGRARFR